LQEVYREGRDVHAETAEIAGINRKLGKQCNFALAYGSGVTGLVENFGFTLEHAQEVMTRVLGAYNGLADYRSTAPEEARAKGFIAIRPNRKVLYDPATSPGTCAINYPIQGGAASVQMRALRLVYDALRERPDLESFVAASVHDEFILETPDDGRADEASEIMTGCMAQALVEIFPEAEAMGVDRLSAAKVCNSWAEKE
jgi:DNA polymerase I-like protein with 3'-5' exonuclease and polymerase domains